MLADHLGNGESPALHEPVRIGTEFLELHDCVRQFDPLVKKYEPEALAVDPRSLSPVEVPDVRTPKTHPAHTNKLEKATLEDI